MAERGYDLVIGARESRSRWSRSPTALARTASRVVPVAGDVTDAAMRARLVDAARDLGGLDVLVNNASELGGIGPLMDFDVHAFRTHLSGERRRADGADSARRPLLAERGGLIVNITSDAAQGAYAGWGPYGASKAALELLTRTLAAELRDRRVSAVIVDPGDMRTRMHQEAFPHEDISDRPLPEVTAPFWHWLFDQAPDDVNGARFAAQAEDARWLQRV